MNWELHRARLHLDFRHDLSRQFTDPKTTYIIAAVERNGLLEGEVYPRIELAAPECRVAACAGA